MFADLYRFVPVSSGMHFSYDNRSMNLAEFQACWLPQLQGCLAKLAKDIELGAIDCQFKPYVTAGCICTRAVLLWCGLGCCSKTVLVIEATAKPAFQNQKFDALLQGH